MNARWSWRLVMVALVGLIAAGCGDPPLEPSPLRDELEQERLRMAPQVGGISNEAPHPVDMATVAAAAQGAMKEAGITLVRTSETAQGNWYLGRSLAGRQVLVQIQPVVPGTTMIRVTVEGNDSIARAVVGRVLSDTSHAIHDKK